MGLAAVVAVAYLVSAAAADATTVCVNSPAGCVGTPAATIAQALTDAASSPVADTIEIAGAHTYSETGLAYAGANPVAIIGVGSSAPVITAAAPESQLLNITNNNSTISNVAFLLPAGSIGTALTTRGPSATGITVTGPAVAANATGIDLVSDDATLSGASVQLPTSGSFQTTAVLTGSDNQIVRDSTLAASQGIFNEAGTGVTVSRVHVVAPIDVETTGGAGNVIEDSVLVDNGNSPIGDEGVYANGAGVSALIRNDTIINDNTSPAFGVATFSGSVTLRDSIVLGFNEDLEDAGPGASFSNDYNDYATTETSSPAAQIKRGPHDLNNIPPGFVNATTGDYHLASNSPLIDKGDPAAPVAGESLTDVFGADRFVAGLGGCAFVRDIGAAEYQRPPTVNASSPMPATATTGTPITFSGSVPCNPGLSTTVA